MKDKALGALAILIALFCILHMVACGVFSLRNPKCNQMTVLRLYREVLTFQKLDEYQ